MPKPKFYQAILVPITNVMEHVYPHLHGTQNEMPLEERIGNGKCPDCDGMEWMLLPKESVAVKEGGKAYIECLGCGYVTHL